MIGKRPYSTSHSARDSWIAAIFTMGEGYHNYHHEFQWDYRNGVKPWQLDPSKWIIWTLSKLGLTSDLKRVPQERILLAETKETKKQLNNQISIFQDSIAESANELVEQAISSLEDLSERLSEITSELQTAAQTKLFSQNLKFMNFKEVQTMLQNTFQVIRIGLNLTVFTFGFPGVVGR